MYRSKQDIPTPKYDILRSFGPVVKYYHVTLVIDNDKPLKIPIEIVMNVYNVPTKVDNYSILPLSMQV